MATSGGQSDSSKRRKPDEVLFTRVDGTPAVVACAFAGKVGRTKTAAVGATILWLLDPALNNLLARFESRGAIKFIESIVEGAPSNDSEHFVAGFTDAHIAGHATYVSRVQTLLSEEHWELFKERHCNEGKAGQDSEEKTTDNKHNTYKKYGNAAVSDPKAVKCLHALTAAALGGASNAVGNSIVRFICWVANECSLKAPVEDEKNTEVAPPSNTKEVVDIDQFGPVFLKWLVKTGSSAWDPLATDLQGPLRKVCESAEKILLELEGHLPRRRKKHRIN